MSGGGSINILAGGTTEGEEDQELLHTVADEINTWLLRELNGVLYAAVCCVRCSDEELSHDLSHVLKTLAEKAFAAKQSKFKALINKDLICFIDEGDPVCPGCDICGRDDAGAKIRTIGRDNGAQRCSLCQRLTELGGLLPKAKFIHEAGTDSPGGLKIEETYYLPASEKKDGDCVYAIYEDSDGFIDGLSGGTVALFSSSFATKNKDLSEGGQKKIEEDRAHLHTELRDCSDAEAAADIREELASLEPDGTATLEYLAKSSSGAQLIAAMRMDADNVGKLVYEGFYGDGSLTSLSAFSRNLNYFFKLHLSDLCKNGLKRDENMSFLSPGGKAGRQVHVIYAGGDDLFALGAWSDVAGMAIDISEAFNNYSCNNIDVGLSGGLTLHDARFPVAKMAQESMAGLQVAKKDRQACWMCRDDWSVCPLLDAGRCLRKGATAFFYTSYNAFKKRALDEKHRRPRYSQDLSRLRVSLKWRYYDSERAVFINEVEKYVLEPLAAFVDKGENVPATFYHSVLSLLETWYDEGLIYLPRIAWMIQKFRGVLRKYIAGEDSKETLYDLYDTYLHFFDSGRFSTLHLPLSWNILLRKGVKKDAN